jgi:hypothetical protein
MGNAEAKSEADAETGRSAEPLITWPGRQLLFSLDLRRVLVRLGSAAPFLQALPPVVGRFLNVAKFLVDVPQMGEDDGIPSVALQRAEQLPLGEIELLLAVVDPAETVR